MTGATWQCRYCGNRTHARCHEVHSATLERAIASANRVPMHPQAWLEYSTTCPFCRKLDRRPRKSTRCFAIVCAIALLSALAGASHGTNSTGFSLIPSAACARQALQGRRFRRPCHQRSAGEGSRPRCYLFLCRMSCLVRAQVPLRGGGTHDPERRSCETSAADVSLSIRLTET